MNYFTKILFFESVKSKMIISVFETLRLSISISPRKINLYKSLKSIKETDAFLFCFALDLIYKRSCGLSKSVMVQKVAGQNPSPAIFSLS